jgi:predicted RNase H-like nuclease
MTCPGPVEPMGAARTLPATPGRVSSAAKDFNLAGYPLLTRSTDEAPGVVEVYPHPALIELMGAERRLPYKATKARAYWEWASPAQRRDLLWREWSELEDCLQTGIERGNRFPS